MVTMAGMAKWFKRYSLLLLIVIFGLSLRLTHLREWLHFEMDEEVVAWKTRQLWQFGKPFLIGGGTPFGIHLGPAFYYLSSIPLWLTQGDPMSWGWLAALVGILTIVLCFYIGTLLYSKRVGIIAALLWSTSFVAAMSDRHWWPLVLDPLLSLLSLLSLFRILRGEKRWWIYLGFILAFAWQTDLTVLPLFFAAVVVAIRNWRQQKKEVMTAMVILLASMLPLVLFEFRHPGANFGKLFQYKFLEGFNLERLNLTRFNLFFVPAGLSRLLFPITHFDGDLSKFYTWCREISDGRVNGQPWWAAGLTVCLLLVPFFSGKFRPAKRGPSLQDKLPNLGDRVLQMIILSGVGGIVIFKLIGGNLYDFYLAVLYPVTLLLAARTIDFIWRKWGIITAGFVTAVIVGLNLTAFMRAYHPQGLAVKQEAVSWVADMLSGKSFALESFSGCNRYNGIRYLFLLKKSEPVMSFMDPNLFWLYDKTPAAEYPDYIVVFVTPSDLTANEWKRYNEVATNVVARKVLGEFEVVVVNNEKRQFSIDF